MVASRTWVTSPPRSRYRSFDPFEPCERCRDSYAGRRTRYTSAKEPNSITWQSLYQNDMQRGLGIHGDWVSLAKEAWKVHRSPCVPVGGVRGTLGRREEPQYVMGNLLVGMTTNGSLDARGVVCSSKGPREWRGRRCRSPQHFGTAERKKRGKVSQIYE